jgi:homoserine kinase
MEHSIKVFSPATIANVGPGFDLMGFALETLGEEIVVKKNTSNKLGLHPVVGFDNIPTDPTKNVATVAVSSMLNALEINQGFDFEFKKSIKPGSGLGTSASSSAGAVFAVNEMLNRPFSIQELVQFAAEGEKFLSGKAHADNVAPALLGGIQLIRGSEPWDVLSIDFPTNIYVTVIHPQVEIQTSEARKILPKNVSLENSITQSGNLAGLIAGLYSNDLALIGRSMTDVIVEPVRSSLIPKYKIVKDAVLESGAFGCNIAGSGPSIFAFSNESKIANNLADVMDKVYRNTAIETRTYVSKIGKKGCRII